MNELYSYQSNDYRSYLAHHGVKGMKWGVRRDKFSNHIKKNKKKIAAGAALGAAAGFGVGAIRHPKQSIPWMDLGEFGTITANIPTYTFGSAARHTIGGAIIGAIGGATVGSIKSKKETNNGMSVLNSINTFADTRDTTELARRRGALVLAPTRTQMEQERERRDRRYPGTKY